MKYITERELNRILAKRDVELINQMRNDFELMIDECEKRVVIRRKSNSILRPGQERKRAGNIIDFVPHGKLK